MDFRIECVWCKTKTEFDKLYRSYECDLAVSYSDIHSRLMKSDPYNEEPSDVIISLYIRKLIKRSLDLKADSEDNNFTIAYLFTSLDQKSVDGLYNFMSDLLEQDFQMNLTVINRSDFPKQGVLSKFNNVRFIDND
jgi:hypothetical protein